MEENPTPNTPLDDTRKQELLHWYNLILTQLQVTKSPIDICVCITFLRFKGEITISEREILIEHFLSIPRPKDADKNSGYYWNRGNRKRRIEFIKEIINNLQDELNLQSNDK